MKRFDKTKTMLNANILAEQRYLASKGLIKESEDCIQVVNGLDGFKREIEDAKYNAESCLIDDCFEVIFNYKNSLDIVKAKQYFDEESELVRVFNEDYGTNLSSEAVYGLIDLFVLENNSDSLMVVIEGRSGDSIKIDACKLYNYISLYSNEDGNILRKIDNKFVEKYKDLVN